MALMLDLKIRLKTEHSKSLDDVMRLMWQRFGREQTGYTYRDYKETCEEVYGGSLEHYFDSYISGTSAFEDELAQLFPHFGFSFNLKHSEKSNERAYGFRLTDK